MLTSNGDWDAPPFLAAVARRANFRRPIVAKLIRPNVTVLTRFFAHFNILFFLRRLRPLDLRDDGASYGDSSTRYVIDDLSRKRRSNFVLLHKCFVEQVTDDVPRDAGHGAVVVLLVHFWSLVYAVSPRASRTFL